MKMITWMIMSKVNGTLEIIDIDDIWWASNPNPQSETASAGLMNGSTITSTYVDRRKDMKEFMAD